MTEPSDRSRAGFTLLEVLIALFALAIVLTAVSGTVGQMLARMSDTRGDQRAVRLGEQKLREVMLQAEAGELPRFGGEDGVFEREDEGDVGYAYRMDVEPFPLPVPKGTRAEQIQGSGLFGAAGARGGTPPAVRRVVLRVYREDESPETGLPFATLLTEPGEAPEGGAGQDPGTGADTPPDNIPQNVLQGLTGSQ